MTSSGTRCLTPLSDHMVVLLKPYRTYRTCTPRMAGQLPVETPGLEKEYQKMAVADCHIMQAQSMVRVARALAGIAGTCPRRGNIGNQAACHVVPHNFTQFFHTNFYGTTFMFWLRIVITSLIVTWCERDDND